LRAHKSRCCIDKTSTAELSEAINSMFRWYQCSKVCYVYLADVSGNFPKNTLELTISRWFTRGWTLQELIAPEKMIFFSNRWRSLGTKKELVSLISSITRIGQKYLLEWNSTRYFRYGNPCIAQIMSWAAERKTTRVEDKAYCLLGLFDINMPLLYGEGRKSFFRLQEELLKCSSDQSLLAWGIEPPLQQLDPDESWTVTVNDPVTTGMFARGPDDFRYSGSVRLPPVSSRLTQASLARFGSTPAVVHRGFRAEMPLFETPHLTRTAAIHGPKIIQQILKTGEVSFAMVQCCVEGNESDLIGIPIMKLSMGDSLRAGYPSYGRCQPLVLIPWLTFEQPEAGCTLVHVDSHWLEDWCFNEPLNPTFWAPRTDSVSAEASDTPEWIE
jgi:hypothetical protein